MVILCADDWVCIFVLFAVQMRRPAQGATGGWVMLGLVFKCFHLCSISLPFCDFFLTYCVCGLLFPGFKVELFLPFGFFPPKVGPVVCVSFL